MATISRAARAVAWVTLDPGDLLVTNADVVLPRLENGSGAFLEVRMHKTILAELEPRQSREEQE